MGYIIFIGLSILCIGFIMSLGTLIYACMTDEQSTKTPLIYNIGICMILIGAIILLICSLIKVYPIITN
jgi:hypothetical protein